MSFTKRESIEEAQAFLPQSRERPSEDLNISAKHGHNARKPATWYLRILVELAMASAIAYLLFRPDPARHLRRTPVPQFPRKIYTFRTDPQYIREDMFFNESTTLHTLHNWIPLSSGSRGYVVIGDSSPYDLPEPYNVSIDRHNDGPGYMMSVFHQLHCLSYLAEHFQQGYGGVKLEEEIAHHSAHCFNYLRQGIMCSADTTLEGHTDAGPGEGSDHECVDYDALLKWANGHSAYTWRNGLLPDEAVL